MPKITTPPPHPCPFRDPESFTEGIDRAQALVQKGCDALDEGRFWAGLALGFAGILRGTGTMLCHPIETIKDICSPDTSDEASAPEDDEDATDAIDEEEA